MAEEGELPWLQDIDADSNNASDVWEDWGVTYRDVQIVGRTGDVEDIYNVTQNDLGDNENFRTLRDLFIDAAATAPATDWQSPVEPLDVNADGQVVPLDALIAINGINNGDAGTLSGTPGTDDYYYDVSGDGNLTPLDPLQVINHLNRSTSSSTPNSAGAAAASTVGGLGVSTPGVAVASVASAAGSDVFFARYMQDLDDSEDENTDRTTTVDFFSS